MMGTNKAILVRTTKSRNRKIVRSILMNPTPTQLLQKRTRTRHLRHLHHPNPHLIRQPQWMIPGRPPNSLHLRWPPRHLHFTYHLSPPPRYRPRYSSPPIIRNIKSRGRAGQVRSRKLSTKPGLPFFPQRAETKIRSIWRIGRK
jgi:hypothetical protein